MSQFSHFFTLFISLFITALPSLLAGIIISSGLLAFIDRHRLAAIFPRNRFLGAIIGSSLGMIFPVSNYGNLPIARRLLVQGVPLSVATSFLVTSPTINPIVIWTTWIAFPHSLRFLFYRILLAWLIGLTIGSLLNTYPDKRLIEMGNDSVDLFTSRSTFLQHGTLAIPAEEVQPQYRAGNLSYEYQVITAIDRPKLVALRLFLENCLKEFLELGSLLMIGCAIAATIQFFLPEVTLLNWAKTPVQQILALFILAPILSLGAVASTFYASSLSSSFLSGSLLGFIQISSLIDIKGLGLYLWAFRFKGVFYILIVSLQITLLFTLLLNYNTN